MTYVDINKSTSKIKASRETSDNFKATITLLASFLRGCIKPYDISCSWGWMR